MFTRLRLPAGVRRLFRLPVSTARRQRELDDEIRFHLGGVRDWLGELNQDFQFGLRQLRRAPAFAATAVVMSALGIGANTAVFSIVHHLILAPLPFADGDRMVMLTMTSNGGMFHVDATQSMVDRWRTSGRAVENIVVLVERSVTVGDTAADAPDRAFAVATVPGAMTFVHMRPALGRDLVPDDTLAGATPVALIGYGRWQRQFGGGMSVLGKTISLNGRAHLIVGVLPTGFSLPFVDGPPASAGIDVVDAQQHVTDDQSVTAIAKLRTGVQAADADRELAALFPPPAAEAARPIADGSHRTASDVPRVMTSADIVGPGYKQIVMMLFGAVGFVQLIACANIANLLLARAWARQREFAVRLALGAGRGRLIRQVLTESVTLAVVGGALGIGVAAAALRMMIAAQPPNLSELDGARLEPAVLAWSLGVALLTGILFGIAPALFASGDAVADSLKSTNRAAAGTTAARRLRGGLVILEVALSVALLAGAGLLVRTLVALHRFDVGFRPHGLAGMDVSLSGPRYAEPAARQSTLNALIDGIRATPGIDAASYAMLLPPDNAIAVMRFEIDGIPASQTDSLEELGTQSATADFFRVAGIPILQGRVFAPNPSLTQPSTDEVLISETFARRFWPGRSPIGARIRQGSMPWAQVVGVVPDVRPPAMAWTNRRMQIYNSLPGGMPRTTLIVRSALPASALSPLIRKLAHQIDPSLRFRRDAVSVDAAISRHMSAHRFVLALLGGFAGLALVLAAIGVYGVIAYGVSQRTREIGVRVALGAQPRDVIGLVLGQGLSLSLIGTVVGAGLAIVATRALGGLLFGVEPGDPATLVAVALLIGLVATAASYIPARRAAKIDPLEALRAE